MKPTDWDYLSGLGVLQSVIDPKDSKGYRNQLIDKIQWSLIRGKIKNSRNLLDFGCGTGRFINRLNNLSVQYQGIDSSPGMIKSAKELHATKSAHFHDFDGINIPFPDNTFDSCLSCGVLQYEVKGQNSQKVLSEIHRVLTPGGRLIIIEQATLSNKTSGLGMTPLIEADYKNELIKSNFSIQSLCKVRGGNLSDSSRFSLRLAYRFPKLFNASLELWAYLEKASIQSASSDYISKMDYYDICIESLAL